MFQRLLVGIVLALWWLWTDVRTILRPNQLLRPWLHNIPMRTHLRPNHRFVAVLFVFPTVRAKINPIQKPNQTKRVLLGGRRGDFECAFVWFANSTSFRNSSSLIALSKQESRTFFEVCYIWKIWRNLLLFVLQNFFFFLQFVLFWKNIIIFEKYSSLSKESRTIVNSLKKKHKSSSGSHRRVGYICLWFLIELFYLFFCFENLKQTKKKIDYFDVCFLQHKIDSSTSFWSHQRSFWGWRYRWWLERKRCWEWQRWWKWQWKAACIATTRFSRGGIVESWRES